MKWSLARLKRSLLNEGKNPMRTARILSVVFLIAISDGCSPSSGGSSLFESSRDVYEMQRECGEQAGKLLDRRWKDAANPANYVNHYNAKLNGCFMLVDEYGTNGDGELLIDVNENKTIGVVLKDANDNVAYCSMGDVRKHELCKTEQEWRAFTEEYMQDKNIWDSLRQATRTRHLRGGK